MCGNEQRLSDRVWMMAVRGNWVGRSTSLLLIVTGLLGTQALSARAQVSETEDDLAATETLAASPPAEIEPPTTVIEVETLAAPPPTELEQPATTVEEWVAQIEASLVQIIDVRVEDTEAGLQIVLKTAEGELAIPTTQTVGNALIADCLSGGVTEWQLVRTVQPDRGHCSGKRDQRAWRSGADRHYGDRCTASR